MEYQNLKNDLSYNAQNIFEMSDIPDLFHNFLRL